LQLEVAAWYSLCSQRGIYLQLGVQAACSANAAEHPELLVVCGNMLCDGYVMSRADGLPEASLINMTDFSHADVAAADSSVCALLAGHGFQLRCK
jgi:hypothetical protein